MPVELGRSFKKVSGTSPDRQPPRPTDGICLYSQHFPFMKLGVPGGPGFTDAHYWCQDQAVGTNSFFSCLLDPNSWVSSEVRNTLAISLEQIVKSKSWAEGRGGSLPTIVRSPSSEWMPLVGNTFYLEIFQINYRLFLFNWTQSVWPSHHIKLQK